MKLMLMIGAAMLALFLGMARAGGPTVPGENLFKWGEYDSLIRVLEPTASAGEARTHADSLARAKSLLFLGVAFCATGKPDRADEAFSRAVDLDPQVELDRYYVTEEIANRFQATALRALRKHTVPPAKAAAATAVATPARPAAVRPAPALAPEAHRQGWVWAGMGTAAALAALAGGYYFLADRGGGAHDEITRIDLSHP